jgi:hypothetical protein
MDFGLRDWNGNTLRYGRKGDRGFGNPVGGGFILSQGEERKVLEERIRRRREEVLVSLVLISAASSQKKRSGQEQYGSLQALSLPRQFGKGS